jgi:hypothetical protein
MAAQAFLCELGAGEATIRLTSVPIKASQTPRMLQMRTSRVSFF